MTRRKEKIVEIHGNNTGDLRAAAEDLVKKQVPGCVIVSSGFGVGKCRHGNLLVSVIYEEPS